jgi:hypothetical protein
VFYYQIASSQYSYQNCTTTFSVSNPNTFPPIAFTPNSAAISATNIITLYLTPVNPISSNSYLRIYPGILKLSYKFNSYSQNTQPYQNLTSDGSLLLSNLAGSTTPPIISLSNFTLVNPPYANKPVAITFTTSNLIGSTFYLIDSGVVNIVCTPSTITSSGISLSVTNINSVSSYTVWFLTVNQLVSNSFILVNFPVDVKIASGSACTLTGGSSKCTITT